MNGLCSIWQSGKSLVPFTDASKVPETLRGAKGRLEDVNRNVAPPVQ